MLDPDDLERLLPAERLRFRSPIPTCPVSSDEFPACAADAAPAHWKRG